MVTKKDRAAVERLVLHMERLRATKGLCREYKALRRQLGEKLRLLRRIADVTQYELAERIGRDQSHVRGLELGMGVGQNCARIAAVLKAIARGRA